jgi:phosphate-selective porin OprO/OprP
MHRSNPSAWARALAATLLLGSFTASPALADEIGGADVVTGGSKPVVEQLLDVMLRNQQISPQQYDVLLEQARDEQAAAAAAVARAAETPAVSSGSDWKAYWKDSFRLERSDGAFKLRFGGRIMADTALVSSGGEIRRAISDSDGSGVEFRRARIFFEGTVYERLFFKAQYDFAATADDDNPDFKDMYLGLKGLGPVRDVRVGHFKEPVFLDEWTSSKYITFMERGLNTALHDGRNRNMGIMASANALDKRLYGQFGIFREADDQGFVFDDWNDSRWDLTMRLSGVPIYADEGARVLHLGATYSRLFRPDDDATIRYRQRPETHLTGRYVDTRFAGADILADAGDFVNGEIAGVWGPLSVQGELTSSWLSGRRGQPNVNFWGAYGFVSYFLTGEQRSYDLGNGRFKRVKPKANFNPAKGEWGAWEIAARYSYLDLDDRNIRGGKIWDVTAGLNWYLFPNSRIMLNYVRANLKDRETGSNPSVDGSSDIFQARFQVDF